MRGDAAARWDRRASGYDAQTAWLERRVMADSRRWVGERARGEVLEVAVGTGANLRYYADGVRITGVDLSEGMLDVARSRAADLGREVTLRRGDAMRLPFGDNAFDTVVCTFALCGVPDVAGALRELVRVARPGGALLLADHVAASNPVLRAVQHLVDLVTVPLEGEHFTRRPLTVLRALDDANVELLEVDRRTLGAIERIHARVRR